MVEGFVIQQTFSGINYYHKISKNGQYLILGRSGSLNIYGFICNVSEL